MFSEFATTNGVAAGVDTTLYPDAVLRSSADYASIASASLQALVTVFALSGHWGDTAPYAGFLADMDRAMIDLQAKGLGWLSVQNITLRQGWSDFDFDPASGVHVGAAPRGMGHRQRLPEILTVTTSPEAAGSLIPGKVSC